MTTVIVLCVGRRQVRPARHRVRRTSSYNSCSDERLRGPNEGLDQTPGAIEVSPHVHTVFMVF